MKIIRVIPIIYLAFGISCATNTSAPVVAATELDSNRKVDSADKFVASTGNIYQSKSYLYFEPDSLYIPVIRYSVEEYNKPDDTLRLHGDTGKVSGKNTISYRIKSARGEQFAFSFKDQLKLWLNANSIVRINVYHGKVTHVTVIGEAYVKTFLPLTFKGMSNFIVHASKGSCFNLRSLMSEATSTVAPTSGSVSISYLHTTVSKPIQLKPGTEFCFSHTDTVCRLIDTLSIRRWTEAKLHYFNNVNLQTLAAEIDRWYKTTTSVNDSLKQLRLTINFPYRIPLDSVLKYVESNAHVDIIRNEEHIEISKSN